MCVGRTDAIGGYTRTAEAPEQSRCLFLYLDRNVAAGEVTVTDRACEMLIAEGWAVPYLRPSLGLTAPVMRDSDIRLKYDKREC